MKCKFFVLFIFVVWGFTVNFVFNSSCTVCHETVQLHTDAIVNGEIC